MRNVVGLAITVLLWSATNSFAQSWAPPAPDKAERDWVQLTSGEWVWGDIKLFEDVELYFDSEEFDDLTIDWEDVAYFRSARTLTYTFTDRRVVTGTGEMRDGVIRIQGTGGVSEFARRELIKIIEGDLSELNFWSVKASLGLTARAGNTDQTDLNAVVRVRREATRTRMDIDYNANYSKVDSVKTIDNQRVGLAWNIIIRRGFFITPFEGDLYRDEFQNIDIRGTVGAGVGIYVFRRSKFEWSLNLGAAYRETHYLSVEPGQAGKDETGSIVPGTDLESDITSNIEFDLTYNAQVGVPDPKNTTHHLQALLSVDIFGDVIDLTVNFTWDRNETPVASADGIVPKRDDYRLALGLGVDL